MKKSLIALAIASAVSAPAFAATSNVDIYGVLNMSMNFVDPDATGQDSGISITSTASRIGFKGAEDLGGGLSGIWQIESGFNADEQSGSLASRNTYLGLKGGFGTVLLGNHDTPMKLLGRMVDNFGDTLGDSRNILGAAADGKSAFDLRTKNTVAYVSPDWSGFTLTAAYVSDWNVKSAMNGAAVTTTNAADANSLDDNNYDAASINGVYNNGPLMLGAAYEIHNGSLSNSDSEMWRIVAGFNVAGFKLAGLYEQMSADSLYPSLNRDAYGLFASYGMGAWTFKGNFLSAMESDAVHSGVSGNDGADSFSIGADYALSKRTVAYGYYTEVRNDTYGGYGLGAGAGASDQTIGNMNSAPTTFSLGVKHAF